MSQWQPYLIAIVIGILVGIEREKAHPTNKTMGVRTFLLVSLLGALAGGLENTWLAGLLAAFALALIVVSYFNQTSKGTSEEDRGLTTEFAAGIIFCLGFVAHTSPTLSAIVGPLVAFILFSKKSLHRFTHAIKPAELEAALLILLAGVIIIDFVPNEVVDPWGVFNPRKFGYLILTLAVIEFSSYVLTKLLGEKRGSLVTGFLGGLVSSTAVLVSSAKNAKKYPDRWANYFSSVLAAKLAALIELLLIVGLVSQTLLVKILVPVGSALLFGGVTLAFSATRIKSQDSKFQLRSPLDWRGVLRLAFMLALILAAVSMAEKFAGENATYVLSFITGFFELHGVALATSTMFDNAQLSEKTAVTSILLATTASLLAKTSIAWFVCGGKFARILTLIFVPMIGLIAITAWIF